MTKFDRAVAGGAGGALHSQRASSNTMQEIQMESDYRLAIELIENAHALITGRDWRDEELRKVLARTIDLLEEVQHTTNQSRSAVIIDLQSRARELGMVRGAGQQ